MKQSAGTLLYRHSPNGPEVLLVHASGPYNRNAPWNLAKGEPDEGENDLEEVFVKIVTPHYQLETV